MTRRGLFGSLVAGVAALWVRPVVTQPVAADWPGLDGHVDFFKRMIRSEPDKAQWLSCASYISPERSCEPCGSFLYLPPGVALDEWAAVKFL